MAIAADRTYLSVVIFFVFVAGLAMCGGESGRRAGSLMMCGHAIRKRTPCMSWRRC